MSETQKALIVPAQARFPICHFTIRIVKWCATPYFIKSVCICHEEDVIWIKQLSLIHLILRCFFEFYNPLTDVCLCSISFVVAEGGGWAECICTKSVLHQKVVNHLIEHGGCQGLCKPTPPSKVSARWEGLSSLLLLRQSSRGFSWVTQKVFCAFFGNFSKFSDILSWKWFNNELSSLWE